MQICTPNHLRDAQAHQYAIFRAMTPGQKNEDCFKMGAELEADYDEGQF